MRDLRAYDEFDDYEQLDAGFTERQHRILSFLVVRSHTRKELGPLVGAANIPQHVLELRRRGFKIVCDRMKVKDRDGRLCLPGKYRLADEDERKRVIAHLKKCSPAAAATECEGKSRQLQSQPRLDSSEAQDA